MAEPLTDSEIATVRIEAERQRRERDHRGIGAESVLLLLDEVDRLRTALAEQRERDAKQCDRKADDARAVEKVAGAQGFYYAAKHANAVRETAEELAADIRRGDA